MFEYVSKVINEPNIIPISNAINKVPVPIPFRCTGDKSADHAYNAGLIIPVAIPKTIDERVNKN